MFQKFNAQIRTTEKNSTSAEFHWKQKLQDKLQWSERFYKYRLEAYINQQCWNRLETEND